MQSIFSISNLLQRDSVLKYDKYFLENNISTVNKNVNNKITHIISSRSILEVSMQTIQSIN